MQGEQYVNKNFWYFERCFVLLCARRTCLLAARERIVVCKIFKCFRRNIWYRLVECRWHVYLRARNASAREILLPYCACRSFVRDLSKIDEGYSFLSVANTRNLAMNRWIMGIFFLRSRCNPSCVDLACRINRGNARDMLPYGINYILMLFTNFVVSLREYRRAVKSVPRRHYIIYWSNVSNLLAPDIFRNIHIRARDAHAHACADMRKCIITL